MRRALCIGIDEYPVGVLNGCVSDAERMSRLLQRHHDWTPNFDCKTLLARRGGPHNEVTRAIARENIDLLFKTPADVALLHFSGHGTVNNLNGYLVTQDAKRYDEGVAMSDVLTMANASPAKEVVVILDCCFSGQMGAVPAIDNTKALLREGVSILTASRGDQPSVEAGGGGVFTSLVVDALDGGAANILGAVTIPGVYAFAEAALGAWEQRPLFKAHVSGLLELRRCGPPISRDTLRNLPYLFPLPAEDLWLDPSFEPTHSAPNPANVAKFAELQALARVHLVVPVDCNHMFDAAMSSKCCRLTPSGRYYWRLAKNGRV